MRYGTKVLTIPSNDEHSVPQLKMMIKELEKLIGSKIALEEWEEL